MRLAIPDMSQDGQIHQTGLGLINLFGSGLFNFLNKELENTEGVDWLTAIRSTIFLFLFFDNSDTNLQRPPFHSDSYTLG
jgi:hypothetical protein